MNRMRLTKSKTRGRRSHHGVAVPACTEEDGVVRLRHRASRVSGLYRGRKVVTVKQRDDGANSKGRPDSQSATDEKKTVEQVSAPK